MIDPIHQELASSYALDLLEPERRTEFERSLASEPELRMLVREFQDVAVALALDCPPQHLPAEAWDRVRLQVEWDRERSRSQNAVRQRTRWAVAGWAAAACLALGWAWFGWDPPTPRSGGPAEVRSHNSESGRSDVAGSATGSTTDAPSPSTQERQVSTARHERPPTEPDPHLLRAQLDAARARERRWSEALVAALNQITNLASQLDAAGTVAPGTRHTRWLGMAPPGQPQLADQAIEAIFNRLPWLLTNLATFPSAPWPDADGGANPPTLDPNPTLNKELLADQRADPTLPGENNEPVGVALWDGRSPTMLVAIAGVQPPPQGQQLVLWGAGAGAAAPGATAMPFNSLGVLASPNAANGLGNLMFVPTPAAAPGSPAATPRLLITLEPIGSPLVMPNGPVIIRSP